MTDSGVVAVNMDEAILSSKVVFADRESILLLTGAVIACREFAGARDSTRARAVHGRPRHALTDNDLPGGGDGTPSAFVLPLEQLLAINEDPIDRRIFTILGTFPHPGNPAVGRQLTLRIVCSSSQEAYEWIETVQAVMTDRNIRSSTAQEQARRSTRPPHHSGVRSRALTTLQRCQRVPQWRR